MCVGEPSVRGPPVYLGLVRAGDRNGLRLEVKEGSLSGT